ncbi:hypothetical protein EHZ18_28405, partial [Burkholderia vietnamiensis]
MERVERLGGAGGGDVHRCLEMGCERAGARTATRIVSVPDVACACRAWAARQTRASGMQMRCAGGVSIGARGDGAGWLRGAGGW